jgi:hypothetical protein
VLVNGEPVAVDGDGAFSLAALLQEGRPVLVDVELENDIGRSARRRRFFPVLDTKSPELLVLYPAKAVPAGRPFRVGGRWTDDGGLRLVGIGELEAALTPGRGAAKRGEWLLTHPGLDAGADLQIVVEDRAGNRVTIPLRVEVE